MQRRRISYAPPPVAPSSYRGTDSVSVEGDEEDDQATLMWQGSSRLPNFGPAPQQWTDTPMAFEPPPARVPAPMPSMAPVAMDLSRAPANARKHDVAAWLPLASAACVTIAIAVFLFAIAFTTSLGSNRHSNASAGATITNVMPAPAKIAPSMVPVMQPTVSVPVAPREETAEPPITITTEPPSAEPRAAEPRTAAVTQPRRNVVTPPAAAAPIAPIAPVEQQPVKKTAAAPRADDEAVSAQKMLEEAQRETAGAL